METALSDRLLGYLRAKLGNRVAFAEPPHRLAGGWVRRNLVDREPAVLVVGIVEDPFEVRSEDGVLVDPVDDVEDALPKSVVDRDVGDVVLLEERDDLARIWILEHLGIRLLAGRNVIAG